MVILHDEEEPHYDDNTIKNELQGFLDEWHYRILHSGLANTLDRTSCMRLAMDLFEMHGMVVTPEEKELFVQKGEDDEASMVEDMVAHIPLNSRKTFEHFVLQLQLVVSTTTQVRHALEEGISEEVARCFEGGETGPGQQILKQCIIEAGKQIHEAMEMHKSWKASTEARVARLRVTDEEAEHTRQQLIAVQSQLQSFKGEQNAKSKKALMGAAGNSDKMLVHTVFSSWFGWLMNHKLNAEIHEKFKQEIADAEEALFQFKKKQLGINRGVLGRAAAQGDLGLQGECLKIWYQWVVVEGHSKAANEKLEAMNARFAAMNQKAKDASKSVLGRMSAGNDAALLTLCVQSWHASMAELKAEKEIDELAKKQEAAYEEFKRRKNGEAKGVLDRMSAGSDAGLLHLMFTEWSAVWKDEKKARELEDMISQQNDRFKSLNQRQKGNAKSVASRTHQQEEENFIMMFFYAWQMDTKTERVIKHYTSKLDQKKGQLDAVQTMFRSFANQLEQGIGNTPRSRRSGAGSTTGQQAAPA